MLDMRPWRRTGDGRPQQRQEDARYGDRCTDDETPIARPDLCEARQQANRGMLFRSKSILRRWIAASHDQKSDLSALRCGSAA